MSTINPNQFSVKIKVPQGILYNKSEKLSEVFKDILEGYLGNTDFRVTSRCFLNSLKCRFTVIFKMNPKHPEAIMSLIEKVAKRTIAEILIKRE